MRNNVDAMMALAGFLILLLFFGFIFAMKISVWNECRVDHSWWYCFQLIRR